MKSLQERLQQSRRASHKMAVLESRVKDRILGEFAALLERHREFLLTQNRRDQEAQRERISESLFQRLVLTDSKLDGLIQGIRDLIGLDDPVNRLLARTELDDGLILDKVTVPLGVVGIIFESRPDVVPQILSLILKSGNAVVMKGGKEAHYSNRAFFQLLETLQDSSPELPEGWACLLEDRQEIWKMLQLPDSLDLIIPRGSKELVRSILAASQIPVLGHSEGVCHLYVDEDADLEKALQLVIDGKLQYPAACNALETLLLHQKIAADFLPALSESAARLGMKLRGCRRTLLQLPGLEAAGEGDWRQEYGNPTLAVRVVDDLEAAIAHINRYGSHHTDSIASRNADTCRRFCAEVDSACVFSNASTRFADGFRFGLGAELGISTARTHARGPVGLEGLTIYKYVLQGQGHVVKDYVGSQAKSLHHRRVK